MLSLIESLRARLGKRVITGKEVKGIDRKNGSFTVHCGDGSEYESDCVVLASPAHSTAGIIREFDRDISSLLRDIPYPPISVVALGYEKAKIFANTNFFGFLMPFKEHRKILGTLFDSSIFPNRAPEGKFLLRSIVGGARAPELALLDDEKLIGAVISELAATAGIKADPEFVRIFRWERAIPQYHVGHYKRIERLDDMLKKHKRLYLHSNAYRGVAVNDCIANSNELAERILSNPHIAAF
jgi:oxygen-dependent protoporphyrinogen oxidase